MNHPNIVRLFDVFEENNEILLVLEFIGNILNYYIIGIIRYYIDGGELFDRIVAKTCYNEKEARDLVFLLLSTIDYCHDRHIVHRDLKPENLLLASKTNDSAIKLADFGFAARVNPKQDDLMAACGTPGYVAPEILNKQPHGKAADMWSIGVICYILLGGYPPFHDENKKKMYASIRAGDYEFHTEYWGNVSEEAKDLIKRLLVVNVKKRMTIKQALQHSWVFIPLENMIYVYIYT